MGRTTNEADVLRTLERESGGPRTALGIVLTALFFSGIAGIINQVIWQRSLKIFLGGSETLSTMSVVLVFMFGLGAGAWFAGRIAQRFRNPLRSFAIVEVALFAVNLLIAWVLSLDISSSVYEFERLALAMGVPLRAVYVLAAIAILAPSCFLMGVTMPISSEVCQRQFGYQNRSLVPVLFVLNTLGATGGAILSGFYLLPFHGQTASLLIAATANGIAGLMLFVLARASRLQAASAATAARSNDESEPMPATIPRPDRGANGWTAIDWLGFALGFLALGYEMYLFRLNTLVWFPLPYTFAATLSLYLLFWSTGVFLASRYPFGLTATALVGVLMIAVSPWCYELQRWYVSSGLLTVLLGVVHLGPCLVFGILYGRLVSQAANSWGRDVGRFCAFNTVGSCLGIALFTLVGYEMNQTITAHIIAAGLLAILFVQSGMEAQTENRSAVLYLWAGAFTVLIAGAYTGFGLQQNRVIQANNIVSYFGRDGVVEIAPSGLMIWDGMEHSALSIDDSEVGGNNWLMATVPVLCHPTGNVDDVLVIGLGCGMTAGTLAKHDDVKNVVVYDINHTLKNLLRDYPAGMRDAGDHPKVDIRWRDGRTGIALNNEQFDLITQQPMYLKQAGSSILLSREYMELVKSRLKPQGVFCIYSYSFDNKQQLAIVRETIESVFPHVASFMDGYMFVASETAINLDPADWRNQIQDDNPFFAEIRSYESKHGTSNRMNLYSLLDYQLPKRPANAIVITDDHPIVEYPDVVERLVVLPEKTTSVFTN